MNRPHSHRAEAAKAQTDTERLSIQMELSNETSRARFEYLSRAQENLLGRIEDVMTLVRTKGYSQDNALHMIEAQCKRVRMIQEELSK